MSIIAIKVLNKEVVYIITKYDSKSILNVTNVYTIIATKVSLLRLNLIYTSVTNIQLKDPLNVIFKIVIPVSNHQEIYIGIKRQFI